VKDFHKSADALKIMLFGIVQEMMAQFQLQSPGEDFSTFLSAKKLLFQEGEGAWISLVLRLGFAILAY